MIPDFLKLRPDLAIKLLMGRTILPIDFEGLDARIHDYAFMISGLTRADLLETTKKLLVRSLSEGTSFTDFADKLGEKIQDSGWSPTGSRVKVIFDTNINKSYWDGKKEQMTTPEMLAVRKFWLWRHRDSVVARPEHKKLHNKAIAADHPFWKEISFPCGFNCFLPDTLVETASGWDKISEVVVGDMVVGGSGHINPVTAIHRNSFVGNMVRTVCEKGLLISSTPNHRILTINGWIKAENIKIGDVLVKVPKGVRLNKFVADISQNNSLACDVNVPFPFPAKRTASNTFDSDVQRRYVDVNPSPIDMMVKPDLQAQTLKVGDHHSFALSRLNFGVHMNTRIVFNTFVESLSSLSFSFFSQKRAISLELFGNLRQRFIVFFCLSHVWVNVAISSFDRSKNLSRLRSSFRVFDPLSLDSVPSMPDRYIEHSQKLRDSSCVDTPPLSDGIKGELFNTIQSVKSLFGGNPLHLLNQCKNILHSSTNKLVILFNVWKGDLFDNFVKNIGFNLPVLADRDHPLVISVDSGIEGFSDGAPINSFNSLNDFQDWCITHCILSSVVDVSHFYYSGDVLNLSVLNDESYNLESATVHNCKCSAFSVTEDYCNRNGIEILTNPPDPKIIVDVGFSRGTDAKTKAQIMKTGLDRLSPNLRSQVKRELKKNVKSKA